MTDALYSARRSDRDGELSRFVVLLDGSACRSMMEHDSMMACNLWEMIGLNEFYNDFYAETQKSLQDTRYCLGTGEASYHAFL